MGGILASSVSSLLRRLLAYGRRCAEPVVCERNSNDQALQPTAPTHRNAQLDLLRGIAIIAVICSHMFAPPTSILGTPLGIVLSTVKSKGWAGVDLFFVLSGFLVSGLLFAEYSRTNTVSIWRFLSRRAFKIYPSYYALILVGASILGGVGVNYFKVLPSMLFFFSNYTMHDFDAATDALWIHSWSLGVEEHFYVLLAVMCWVLARFKRSLKAIPTICVSICVTVLLLRLATSLVCPDWDNRNSATHLRLDGLSFGVLLSYLHFHHRAMIEKFFTSRRVPLLCIAAILLIVGLLNRSNSWLYVCCPSFLYLGFGIVVLSCVINPLPTTTATRAIAWIGTYSYSIYVWHRLPELFIEAAFHQDRGIEIYLLKNSVFFVCAVLYGIWMAQIIEIPFLNIRDSLLPFWQSKRKSSSDQAPVVFPLLAAGPRKQSLSLPAIE